jgi:hypothetical protein
MIPISVDHFNFDKIARTISTFEHGDSLYHSMAGHDLQPLSAKRRNLNKPQDLGHSKRLVKSTVAMSHLKDRRLTNEHLRERNTIGRRKSPLLNGKVSLF